MDILGTCTGVGVLCAAESTCILELRGGRPGSQALLSSKVVIRAACTRHANKHTRARSEREREREREREDYTAGGLSDEARLE